MARQPARSALLLTTIAVGLLGHCACGGSSFSPSSSSSSSSSSTLSNGSGVAFYAGIPSDIDDIIDSETSESVALSNAPKFGDRISPRHRPYPATSTSVEDNSNISNSGNSFLSSSNSNNNQYNNSGKERVRLSSDSSYVIKSNEIRTTPINGSHERERDRDRDRTVVTRRVTNSSSNANNVIMRKSDDDVPLMSNEIDQIPIGAVDNQLERNVSSAQAHRLEMSTEFFVVPSTASSMTRSTTIRPGGVILAAKTTPSPSLQNSNSSNSRGGNATPPTIVSTHPTGLRKEPWVVPVLVLSSLSMIMMAAFEIFVLCKAWRTSPSRRHLFLGQMLLLGLFSCAGLAAVLTATPTLLSCAIVRFGAGVAFALVFASLLVKCVFLISLNGGVYLPAPYQGLLLLFAVLIQVAVGSQWLLTSPPAVDIVPVPARNAAGGTTSTTSLSNGRFSLLVTAGDLSNIVTPTIPLCRTPFSELLLSLVYVVFLILFVAVLAIKSRGIRDNYREATYIGLAIGGSIPIWLGWTLCGLAVADRHRDACLAFGLVATSTTVFLVMFMPKGRQLAAMGKEGLYVEDREERFSSLSRAGSGYSPSFFHFKPIKYGVMGTATMSNTNTGVGNGTSTKHHQAVATLGGDRVALVAAPPSYTRMYHYFPAHLTHPLCYYPTTAPPPLSPHQQTQTARYPGLFMRPDDANLYTTLEPTMSSNPNVYFQRGGGVHPGMMY